MTDDLVARLDAADEAFAAGDFAAAEAGAQQVLRALRRRGAVADPELALDAELMLAELHIEQRRDAEALARLARLRQEHPDLADARLLEGRLRLLRWELDEAERLLAEGPGAAAVAPRDPAGEGGSGDSLAAAFAYDRAILAELRGDAAAADALYAEAARLDPETSPLPVRMSDDEARALLAELVESFPADVRGALDNMTIDIVDVPTRAVDGGHDTDPLLLGLYSGVPITERESAGVSMPGSVRIFKRNIERLAADRDALVEELRITLLHEVGHHLGWDEDDLHERGLG